MKKYKSIDGLKAISIIIIILVHVAINGNYKIDNYYYNFAIQHLRVFIEMFFILSAFGMCCGYYEKIKNREIDLNTFYKKRIIKIWPYFALLILVDLISSGFTQKNIIEAFLDGTLFIGFLPNNYIDIAGIGWTLGVIFAFYFLFPFFVFIMWNKVRAWIALAVFVLIKIFGDSYIYSSGQPHNGFFLTWFYLFIIGGLIYLYKEQLIKIFQRKEYLLVIIFILLFIGEALLYQNGHSVIAGYMVKLSFAVMIIYCLVERFPIVGNKVLVFIGGLCLQIYIFHIIVLRAIEKLGLLHAFGNEVLSLIISVVITLAVTTGISYLITKVLNYKKWSKKN